MSFATIQNVLNTNLRWMPFACWPFVPWFLRAFRWPRLWLSSSSPPSLFARRRRPDFLPLHRHLVSPLALLPVSPPMTSPSPRRRLYSASGHKNKQTITRTTKTLRVPKALILLFFSKLKWHNIVPFHSLVDRRRQKFRRKPAKQGCSSDGRFSIRFRFH